MFETRKICPLIGGELPINCRETGCALWLASDDSCVITVLPSAIRAAAEDITDALRYLG